MTEPADEPTIAGVSRGPRPLTSEAQLIAVALLELIAPDPDAAQHRLDLHRELASRQP